MTEILDRSYDQETKELTQFLVLEDGEPQLKRATAANVLLYDPEDELPFENGMYGFLQGDEAIVLSDDPTVIIAPTTSEKCYIIRVRDNTVETTPTQAQKVLEGVKRAAIDGDVDMLLDVYDNIMSKQVRRPVINAIHETFDEQSRIEISDRGWLIDDFYLVNWEASLYLRHNDPEEGDYKRGGGGVTKTDRSYEFVQLDLHREIDPIEVQINGESYRLTEREMLFLAKVKWLLNRREHHPDKPFWIFADRRASVDELTGEPVDDAVSDDDANTDTFNL